MTVWPRLGVGLALAAVYVVACSSVADPLDSVVPEFARQVETYEGGQFVYEGSSCSFTPPNSTVTYTFACGEILIGLKRGFQAKDLEDILRELSGSLLKDRTTGTGMSTDYPWMAISVPVGTERTAILRAFEDARVRYAALDFTGPAALLGLGDTSN